jgi:hypothetical protein
MPFRERRGPPTTAGGPGSRFSPGRPRVRADCELPHRGIPPPPPGFLTLGFVVLLVVLAGAVLDELPLLRTVGVVRLELPLLRTVGEVRLDPPLLRTVGVVRLELPLLRTVGEVRLDPPLLRTVGEVRLDPPLLRTVGEVRLDPPIRLPDPATEDRVPPRLAVPPELDVDPPPGLMTRLEGRVVRVGVVAGVPGPGRLSSVGRLVLVPEDRVVPERVWAFPPEDALGREARGVVDPGDTRLGAADEEELPERRLAVPSTPGTAPGRRPVVSPGLKADGTPALGTARLFPLLSTPGRFAGGVVRVTTWGVPASPRALSLKPKWATPRLGWT